MKLFGYKETSPKYTPRLSYAKVYLNGSYRGLYNIVEQIDKTFVRDRFPSDTTGYLHKSFKYEFDQLLLKRFKFIKRIIKLFHQYLKILHPL